MALCISAQRRLHLPEEQVRVGEGVRHQHFGAASPGRASRCGQAVRGRSRARPRPARSASAGRPMRSRVRGARLRREPGSRGVVLRPVAVDQPQIEQARRRQGVAGREVEVVRHELGEVGRRRPECPTRRPADGCRRSSRRSSRGRPRARGRLGMPRPANRSPEAGRAEEVACRGRRRGSVASFCSSCVRCRRQRTPARVTRA